MTGSKREDFGDGVISASAARKSDRTSTPAAPWRYTTPYDRYVQVMRVFLPAVVVLFTGASLLWPALDNGETSFLLNKDGMPGAGRAVRVLGAVYRGTDNAGRQFQVAAEEALQDEPDAPLVRLSAVDASIALSEGRFAAFHADDGVYDTRDDSLDIPGAIRIETSDGYRLESADARIDLKGRTLGSDAPVSGTGPLGTLSAEGFAIDLESGKAVFMSKVRMLTTPKQKD